MTTNNLELQELDPESRRCPICSSGDLCHFTAKAFDAANQSINIVECNHCNFAWQYPHIRSEEQSVNYFEAAYLDNGQTNSDYFNQDVKKAISELEIAFVEALPQIGNRLLDIGGGSGVFAETAAEHGFDSTVLDPALVAGHADAVFKATRIKGHIDDLQPGDQYDVITLWDVIEHVTSPISLLKYIMPHLKEEGWLVVATGNYKCANRVAESSLHWIYQADHRWYFSPDSMTKLIERLGFSEIRFVNKVLRPEWNGSAEYPGPSRAQLVSAILSNPLDLRSQISKYHRLQQAKNWNLSGIDILTVAARKPVPSKAI